MNLNILYEDKYIIVCHKPANTATQSSKIGEPDMVSLLKNHIYKSAADTEPYLAVIHRLDQPVEGVLVFAKTPFAARELNQQIQTHVFGKYYLAQLACRPTENSQTLEDFMVKDGKTNTSRICSPNTPGAKKARLYYEVLEQRHSTHPNAVWVHLKLDTGRHHQIRVQMAHLGCPIWGDSKYNPAHCNQKIWSQIELYAYKLTFLHPKTKKPLEFELSI